MSFLFLVTILVSFITAKAEEFTFGQDLDKLEMCVEHYLSKDPNLKLGKITKNISKMISKRFISKSYDKTQFNRIASNVYYYIKTRRSDLFVNDYVPEELKIAMNKALQSCVEKKNLPRFVREPQVLADLLDIILVDWPVSLNEMVSTQEGRSTLRLYAYSAGSRLMSALKYFSMDYDVFHNELQRIWMLRAQYFDDCSPKFFYIRHRFTTNIDKIYSSIPLQDIHTIDDMNHFMNRNPWRLNLTFNAMLEKAADYSQSNRIMNQYYKSFQSKAEQYLKAHIDQCYRIIMYTLELQLKGINTDEDDVYYGPIPSDVVQPFIQKIIWDEATYQNYLLFWRENLKNLSIQYFDGCFSNDSKEDLIMMLSLFILRKNARTVPSTTTSATTVMITTSTESPHYEEEIKKGGIRKLHCKKYFLPDKRFKIRNPEPDQESGQIKNEQYGFITKSDSNQLMSLEGDQSIISKILVGFNPASKKLLCD